jgi:hypothetical protein
MAQTDRPRYLDPNLPPETRAADLVSRMTLERKASQMVNQSRAIPRLGVLAYDWWNEASRSSPNRWAWRRPSTAHRAQAGFNSEVKIEKAFSARSISGPLPAAVHCALDTLVQAAQSRSSKEIL